MPYRVLKDGRCVKVPLREDHIVEKATRAAEKAVDVKVEDVDIDTPEAPRPMPRNKRKKPRHGTARKKIAKQNAG